MSPILKITDVSAGYGSFQALRDVSLEVNSGEAVGIIGPNGAGKTTLLRTVSGLVPAWSGMITLDGAPLSRVAPHTLLARGIAHVPEGRRLFPRMTVEENMHMGAFLPDARREFHQRVEWVYGLFPRMKERRHQLAGTLSGGEQQMCAIGRALMSRPRILLLDEPSAGLAPLVVGHIFDLVRRIRSEGFTVMIVEQNVRQILKLVDRAYLLEVGRIKFSGTASEMSGNKLITSSYFGLTI